MKSMVQVSSTHRISYGSAAVGHGQREDGHVCPPSHPVGLRLILNQRRKVWLGSLL